MSERPTVDQYFMDMTHLVKARGTCPRRLVGAVIVKDKRVLTTGYNGAPRNFPHPIEVGCLRDELAIPRGMIADICPCLHAEQNAILQAATTGVSIEGADLFVTTQPCTQCSRMLANCGIKRVIFEEEYPDPLAVGILTTAGVELWKWDAAGKKAKRVAGANTFQEAQDAIRKKWKRGEMSPAPRPGAALKEVPRSAPKDDPDEESADEDEPATPAPRVTRDLRNDPNRAELLRKLAHEKVERLRREKK